MISNTNVLIFSFLGGILPAFFWLWFWLRQDREKPEPKSALLGAFFGGIIAVFLALFFELTLYYILVEANPHLLDSSPKIFSDFLQAFTTKYNISGFQNIWWSKIQNLINNGIKINELKKIALVVFIAPFIEELFKWIMAYSICLRRKVNDEPVDASIYMLTTALGFAAIETTLFLTEPLTKGNIIDTLVMGNFRSVGPMLIHLISSVILGLFIGLAFYKSKIKKFFYAVTGFILATILHSFFNFFIVLNEITKSTLYFWLACTGTWFLIIILLILFKKVKTISS